MGLSWEVDQTECKKENQINTIRQIWYKYINITNITIKTWKVYNQCYLPWY